VSCSLVTYDRHEVIDSMLTTLYTQQASASAVLFRADTQVKI